MIPAILSIYPRGKKIYIYIKTIHNVTSSLTCNSQKLQITQMSTTILIAMDWIVCPPNSYVEALILNIFIFVMGRLVTTVEVVLCDVCSHKRWVSFCLVFFWCSLLELSPHDVRKLKHPWWGFVDSSIWPLSCNQYQPAFGWVTSSLWVTPAKVLTLWSREEVSLMYPSWIPDPQNLWAQTVVLLGRRRNGNNKRKGRIQFSWKIRKDLWVVLVAFES